MQRRPHSSSARPRQSPDLPAALLVAFPTVAYLWWTQTVRTLPVFMYVIMAMIGVMFTLIGSYLGERIQMGPPPKPVE